MSTKPVWPDGVGRSVLPRVDSTNAEAARRAASLAGPEWILALAQEAGRGRRGRAWHMTPGNFAATLVMRPAEDAAVVALRSFVAALALHDALADVTGRPEALTLKWPNDVLLNGGKIAGILLESTGAGGVAASGAGGVSHIAIGIGVNLAAAPSAAEVEEGATPPVSLKGETGLTIAPEDFLTHLAAAYARYEAQFTSLGFAPIRIAWLARAARLGQPVRARTMRAETTGTFEDIDAAGNLVLTTPRGRVTIPAAEIFFD